MTYDDALDVHLDHAMPDLESRGLRGTFYVPTRLPRPTAWAQRPGDWCAAARRGHEIANHTQYHPCSRLYIFSNKSTSPLEAYTPARLEAELRGAAADIRAVTGVNQPTSFAYPCCHDWVGPEHASARPIAAGLFPASRGGPERALADPWTCDFDCLPAWMMLGIRPLASILALIEEAAERRQWAILMFHGVGGGHRINVRRAVHQSLCAYLHENRRRIWCDTVVNVAQHLRTATGRAWGGGA
jgi:sialate O-acetylesterase